MGVMTFLIPDNLPADVERELRRAAIAGGPDNMPTQTNLSFATGQMRTRRGVDESGYLMAPWQVDGFGLVMGSTATLMERTRPYNLVAELARGKVNQMRCQAADWKMGGLQVSADLNDAIRAATLAFGKAVTAAAGGASKADETRQAEAALTLAYRSARQLIDAYTTQVFHIRHQRSPRLETALGCRVTPTAEGVPEPLSSGSAPLTEAVNSVSIPFSWCDIEPEEGVFKWQPHDDLLQWAVGQELHVTAGPLVDFSSFQLPSWLWLWENDVPTIASFMCKFVESVVRRYRGQINRWQLCSGSNCANVLGLTEEELLGLTYRLADTIRQVDPSLEVVIGIASPWGEYMAQQEYLHSPFIFADTLIRSGINNLAALDVELVMGVTPRGSYSRDLLDASRLLDLYALLGVPLRVTLGFPAAATADPNADPELRVDAGRWRDGFTPAMQAEWAMEYAGLALCKPFVQSVQWCHLTDAQPHQFPHAGLLDGQGQARPALARLRELRQRHLN